MNAMSEFIRWLIIIIITQILATTYALINLRRQGTSFWEECLIFVEGVGAIVIIISIARAITQTIAIYFSIGWWTALLLWPLAILILLIVIRFQDHA